MLDDCPILGWRHPDGTGAAYTPAVLAGAARFGGSSRFEAVDDLAQADMDLVQRISARCVGDQLVIDRLADDGVYLASLVFGRGWRDVKLSEESGDDPLFFPCYGGVSVTLARKNERSKKGERGDLSAYWVHSRPTSQ